MDKIPVIFRNWFEAIGQAKEDGDKISFFWRVTSTILISISLFVLFMSLLATLFGPFGVGAGVIITLVLGFVWLFTALEV